MINNNNLSESIEVLIENNFTFGLLRSSFPEILADLIATKVNPHSSSKYKVLKFFSEKLKTNPNLLDHYVVDGEFNKKINLKNEQKMGNNYSGRVITVGKSEEEWQSFSDSLRGKMFRTFSIVERKDSIAVYFL